MHIHTGEATSTLLTTSKFTLLQHLLYMVSSKTMAIA